MKHPFMTGAEVLRAIAAGDIGKIGVQAWFDEGANDFHIYKLEEQIAMATDNGIFDYANFLRECTLYPEKLTNAGNLAKMQVQNAEIKDTDVATGRQVFAWLAEGKQVQVHFTGKWESLEDLHRNMLGYYLSEVLKAGEKQLSGYWRIAP